MVATISLRDIIDDILLLVRNNNISESEDLSRGQIAIWVKTYKNALWRERLDALKEQAKNPSIEVQDLVDDLFIKRKETGPHELEEVESKDDKQLFTKRTVEALQNVFNNSGSSILAIHDQEGDNIQYMNHIRRHYHYFRKYTFGETTAYYMDDGHIYVQGPQAIDNLQYIWVLALYEEPDNMDSGDNEDSPDEEDIKIPAWMVPSIKERIIKNDLSFMLGRPSDDSNNATLASIKPHGPQDDEQ